MNKAYFNLLDPCWINWKIAFIVVLSSHLSVDFGTVVSKPQYLGNAKLCSSLYDIKSVIFVLQMLEFSKTLDNIIMKV